MVGSEDDGEDVKIGVENKEDRVLGSIAHLFETEEPTVASLHEQRAGAGEIHFIGGRV